jgi:uncharacterized protein (DUF4415 family)
MQKKPPIERASAEALRVMLATGADQSDWPAARAIPQSQIEILANAEDGILPEGWEAQITLGIPEPKQDVHIRLDPMVLRWFKSQGPGYQTRINAVLRSFVEAKQKA